MAERGEEQFLRVMDNPDIYWEFDLVGDRRIVGRVLNYLKTTQGIPLTLMVMVGHKEEFVRTHTGFTQTRAWDEHLEIPWTIIQTIRKHKESK